MALTDAQFEEVYPNYRRRLFGHGTWPFRERALERDRIRPLFDACDDFGRGLSRAEYLGASGRDRLADTLLKNFGEDHEKYGIAWLWVFAIVLKVIASVLIDLWLLQSPHQEGQQSIEKEQRSN